MESDKPTTALVRRGPLALIIARILGEKKNQKALPAPASVPVRRSAPTSPMGVVRSRGNAVGNDPHEVIDVDYTLVDEHTPADNAGGGAEPPADGSGTGNGGTETPNNGPGFWASRRGTLVIAIGIGLILGLFLTVKGCFFTPKAAKDGNGVISAEQLIQIKGQALQQAFKAVDGDSLFPVEHKFGDRDFYRFSTQRAWAEFFAAKVKATKVPEKIETSKKNHTSLGFTEATQDHLVLWWTTDQMGKNVDPKTAAATWQETVKRIHYVDGDSLEYSTPDYVYNVWAVYSDSLASKLQRATVSAKEAEKAIKDFRTKEETRTDWVLKYFLWLFGAVCAGLGVHAFAWKQIRDKGKTNQWIASLPVGILTGSLMFYFGVAPVRFPDHDLAHPEVVVWVIVFSLLFWTFSDSTMDRERAEYEDRKDKEAKAKAKKDAGK